MFQLIKIKNKNKNKKTTGHTKNYTSTCNVVVKDSMLLASFKSLYLLCVTGSKNVLLLRATYHRKSIRKKKHEKFLHNM